MVSCVVVLLAFPAGGAARVAATSFLPDPTPATASSAASEVAAASPTAVGRATVPSIPPAAGAGARTETSGQPSSGQPSSGQRSAPQRTDRPAGAPPASGRSASLPQTQRTGWTLPASRIDRLVLVGDSLAQEVNPILQILTPGKTPVSKFWGGTAPCDWLGVDLEATRRSVVVITFTGNSLTDCMVGPDGRHLADAALVEQYRYDVGQLIDTARRAGARVVLVGQPHRAPSFEAELEVEGINAMYRDYAQRFRFVSYVDAGRAVETVDGSFAERLPCTVHDIDCAPDGTTVVRGDGVHFCPVAGENPCSVWSSGAFRFGIVIASAANNPRPFD